MAGQEIDRDCDKPKENERKSRWRRFFTENWFMISTLVGVAVGFGIAFGVRSAHLDRDSITWISKIPITACHRDLQLSALFEILIAL